MNDGFSFVGSQVQCEMGLFVLPIDAHLVVPGTGIGGEPAVYDQREAVRVDPVAFHGTGLDEYVVLLLERLPSRSRETEKEGHQCAYRSQTREHSTTSPSLHFGHIVPQPP